MLRTLGLLVVLAVVLQAQAASADCGAQMAQCSRLGQKFCGQPVGAVACIFQCCPTDYNGCCVFEDALGKGAECCPGPPRYTCAPDCQCVHPCSGQCCGENEVCVTPSDPGSPEKCCPTSQVCENNCCFPPEVCAPDGTCCAPGNVCDGRCCSVGAVCCNGVCCGAGYACYREVGVCCPQTVSPCGDKCCPPNQKCKSKHKPAVCRCKQKAKGPKCGAIPCKKHPKTLCGGIRCCEGDQCIDGDCTSPLP